VDKSKTIYPIVDPGAVFTSTNSTWTFSSGAQIRLSYFETYDQVESLQGISYAYIGIDEIGTYENDRIFKYALSRLRSPEGLKCYFRATSNPSRYKWLREFFRIDDVGTSTSFKIQYTMSDGTIQSKSIRYIQAMLRDNPYLGHDYEAQLMMLPEDERKALLEGNWSAYDVVEGLIYEHELREIHKDHRYSAVPYEPSQPVYTFWDIGINDQAVILFVQFIGKEIHIINMLKGNNKSMKDHWIPTVLRYVDDFGYSFGMHHLPHDSAQRDKFTGRTLYDESAAILRKCKQLVRPSRKIEIIQSTRTMFKRVWIDNSRCSELMDDLSNYKREYDDENNIWSNNPVHNSASHSADALSYISLYEEPSKVTSSSFKSSKMQTAKVF